ncbi:MAG: hypothetical protein ACPKM1_15800 [Spirochaetaceae bacterium]
MDANALKALLKAAMERLMAVQKENAELRDRVNTYEGMFRRMDAVIIRKDAGMVAGRF